MGHGRFQDSIEKAKLYGRDQKKEEKAWEWKFWIILCDFYYFKSVIKQTNNI